jgi:hypothetical protein
MWRITKKVRQNAPNCAIYRIIANTLPGLPDSYCRRFAQTAATFAATDAGAAFFRISSRLRREGRGGFQLVDPPLGHDGVDDLSADLVDVPHPHP